MNTHRPGAASNPTAPERVDWSQLWHPGPRRVFTPEELARAGADAPTRTLALPPGLPLTLVENAVEHGVQPSLGGAEVHVHGEVAGNTVVLHVDDSGAGLAADLAEGVGLANSRARLAQAWGAAAMLTLQPRAGGGCSATVTLPRAALQTPVAQP